MGRGDIKSGGPLGKYTVAADYWMIKLENEIDVLATVITNYDTLITELDAEIQEWQTAIDDVQAELDTYDSRTLDPSNKLYDENEAAHYKDFQDDKFEYNREKQIRENQKKWAKLEREAAVLRKEKLEELQTRLETDQIDIWCADLSTDLPLGFCGTIEVPNELFGNTMQIRPGFQGEGVSSNAPWVAARDGQLAPLLAQSPAATVYNLAMLPGKQKWKPQYRYGEITFMSIYDEEADPPQTATVSLDTQYSSQQTLHINQESTLYLVPFQYMECDSGAFTVGDTVLVEFTDRDWEKPVIIGFKDNPKKCEKRVFALVECWFVRGMETVEEEPYAPNRGSAGSTSSSGITICPTLPSLAFTWDVHNNRQIPLTGLTPQPTLTADLEVALETMFDVDNLDTLEVTPAQPNLFKIDLWQPDQPGADQLRPFVEWFDHGVIKAAANYPQAEWVGPDGDPTYTIITPEFSSTSMVPNNFWGDGLGYTQGAIPPGSDEEIGVFFPYHPDPAAAWHYGDVPFSEDMYHSTVYKYPAWSYPHMPTDDGDLSRWRDNRAHVPWGPDMYNQATHWPYGNPATTNGFTYLSEDYVSVWGESFLDHESEDDHDQAIWWFGAKFWIWPWYVVPGFPPEQDVDVGAIWEGEKQYHSIGGFSVKITSLTCAHDERHWSWGAYPGGSYELSNIWCHHFANEHLLVGRHCWNGAWPNTYKWYPVDTHFYDYHVGGSGGPLETNFDWYNWDGSDGPFGIKCLADDTVRYFKIRLNGEGSVIDSTWKYKRHTCVYDAGWGLGGYLNSLWVDAKWEYGKTYEYSLFSEEDGGSPLNTGSEWVTNVCKYHFKHTFESDNGANYRGDEIQFAKDGKHAYDYRPSWSDAGNTIHDLTPHGYADQEGPEVDFSRHQFEMWPWTEGFYFDPDETPTDPYKLQFGISVVMTGVTKSFWTDYNDINEWQWKTPDGWFPYPAYPGLNMSSYDIQDSKYFVEAVCSTTVASPGVQNPFTVTGTNEALAAEVKNLLAYNHQVNGPHQDVPSDTFQLTENYWVLLSHFRYVPRFRIRLYAIDKNKGW